MVWSFAMTNTNKNQKQMTRSNPPGTKSEDFYKWPPQPLEEMESTLAVQQYIQQQIRKDYKDYENILKMPPGQDEAVWKYEQLRQFCLELNLLATYLQSECHPHTCEQMTATDQWVFLCAAHKTPQECPAIDYTRHTLDGAASLLNSNKYFPSRVSIKESSISKLGSVCRRVYRIFSHAYWHHREIFDQAENETYLCRRFTRFVTRYNLMTSQNLIVPIFESEDKPQLTQFINNNNSQDKVANILNLPSELIGEDDDNGIDEVTTDFDFLQEMESEGDGFEEASDFDFSPTSADTFATLKPGRKSVIPNYNNNNDETLVEQDNYDEDANLTLRESGDNLSTSIDENAVGLEVSAGDFESTHQKIEDIEENAESEC